MARIPVIRDNTQESKWRHGLLFLQAIVSGDGLDYEKIYDSERKTFIRLENPVEQYSAFFIGIVVASIIACGGLLLRSTAVVIGAMLVAPLMNPIVGTALAVSEGKAREAFRTLEISFMGMGSTVFVAIFCTWALPVNVDVRTNSEILPSRSMYYSWL